MNNLITLYILNKKQNNYIIISSLTAVILLLLRVKLTHSFYLLFLIWNLILAIIPYTISFQVKTDFRFRKNNIKNLFYIVIWLLFIPNTFYLITDFVHLYYNNFWQYIFDFILLSSFTIAGFYLGILSIYTIYEQIRYYYSVKLANAFTIVISYLCAFGIYLGRFLRFNSWDIITQPIILFNSIIKSVFQVEALVFTLFIGTLIVLVSLTYFKLKSNN